MGKTYYMHTLNGYPAALSQEGDRVRYATNEFPKANSLERSLRNIRKNERKSRQHYSSLGIECHAHGYFRFEVPDD